VAFSTVASLQLNDVPKLPATYSPAMRKTTLQKVFSSQNDEDLHILSGVFTASKSSFQQILRCFSEMLREKTHFKTFFSERMTEKKETSFACAMARQGHSKKMVKEVSENCKYEKPTNKI
jgi:hypothetical protein